MAELDYLLRNTMRLAFVLLLCAELSAQPNVITPSGAAKPVGPYSPGLEAGGWVYVSGQGALDAQSKMPAGIEAQTRQCLENVKAILTAAGLTMEHVVHTQVYLLDLAGLPAADRVYSEYFPKNAPARITLGVARMPVGTPVEITAWAVKDLAKKRQVRGGVLAGDRLFLHGISGATAVEAERKLAGALSAAGFRSNQVVYTNRYEPGSAAPDRVPVNALPGGAGAAILAIASKEKIQRGKGCVVAGDTAFCGVQGPASSGASIEAQTTEVFETMKTSLTSVGFSLANAVATNVYLADIGQFQTMNARYASFFSAAPPTRTTVQPPPAGAPGPGFRLSLIVVK